MEDVVGENQIGRLDHSGGSRTIRRCSLQDPIRTSGGHIRQFASDCPHVIESVEEISDGIPSAGDQSALRGVPDLSRPANVPVAHLGSLHIENDLELGILLDRPGQFVDIGFGQAEKRPGLRRVRVPIRRPELHGGPGQDRPGQPL